MLNVKLYILTGLAMSIDILLSAITCMIYLFVVPENKMMIGYVERWYGKQLLKNTQK